MDQFLRRLLAGFLSLCVFTAYAQQSPPCGVTDQPLPDNMVRMMGQLPQMMTNQRARLAASERRVCRVAIEIDSDTYIEFDKDTNRIRSYVLDQMEIVSKIYEREINTQLSVVNIHIWKDTEPDPYRGELSIHALHAKFRTVWNSQFKQVAADKRLYLLTKPAYGAGGLGDMPGMYSIGFISTYIIAHELGHNFGSPHTQSCSWPGGPIDFCSTSEGECYKGSLENITGTIMSYCNTTAPTFHPYSQAMMSDHATKNLAVLAAPDKAPTLPAQLTLAGTPYLYWAGLPNAERYDVEVSTTADFAQKIISDTTGVSGYDMQKLVGNQPYYVRIRVTNRLGASAWSAVSQLKRVWASGIAAPVLLTPSSDQRMLPYNRGVRQFTLQPVEGATSYEVQITNATDELFKSPIAKLTQPTASFTATAGQMGVVRWRARALVGTKAGPWSAPGRYAVSPEPYYFNLPFYMNDAAPLSFPFSYYQVVPRSTMQITLATDSTFTKPVYTRTIAGQPGYNYLVGVTDKLTANTQYYLKAEESSSEQSLLPDGLLTRTVQTFKTGAATLSDRWSFVNSVSNPNWPSGGTFGSLAVADNAVWYNTTNGITRISQDSAAIRLYTPGNTGGKIGSLSAALSNDTDRSIWLTNRTSINIFKNGFAVPYYQVGKLSEQTGALTDVTTYSSNLYFSSFSSTPRLFFSYNTIYEPRADTLAKIYTLPDNRSIIQTLVRPGTIWMVQYNTSSTTAPYELVQVNTLTKTTQVFNAENTPQLGKYLNYLAMDGLGNLWVSQSSTTAVPPLVRFDGQTWTTVERSTSMPISYVVNMTSDPLGNLFVIDNTAPRSLYKYDGTSWKKLAEMPLYTGMGTMKADAQGNIWFNGAMQLVKYAACANAPAPALKVTKQTIEIGESTTLQAAGCTDVVWSWSSETETVTNRLVRGTNQLVIKPEANTTYRSRCYTVSCAGEETTMNVTVLPKLILNKTARSSYCQGDSLTVGYGLLGKVGANNQFSVVLKAGAQLATYPAIARTSELTTQLPTSLTPGRYVVYLETTQPVVRTADSVQVTVLAQPTAELSSNKMTFFLGDSARVSVTLTGTPPWQFTRWDGQVVQSPASPYVVALRALQPINYNLTITKLSDASCSAGTIKNSVTVSAMALGNEPVAAGNVTVYPNPTTGWLVVETTAATAPFTMLRLIDAQGREISQKVPVGRSHREEWDVSALPVGPYVLRVETTDGGQSSWKVLKQ